VPAVCGLDYVVYRAGDGEVEEEELDGVVDESIEQEFSFSEFVLR